MDFAGSDAPAGKSALLLRLDEKPSVREVDRYAHPDLFVVSPFISYPIFTALY